MPGPLLGLGALHTSLLFLSQYSSTPLPQGFSLGILPQTFTQPVLLPPSPCSDVTSWGGAGLLFQKADLRPPTFFFFSPQYLLLVHMIGWFLASGGPAQSGDFIGLSCCSVSI